MITFIRSASIAPGKTGDAIAFAQHMAKHFQEKYNRKLVVLMPIGGNPNRIAWLSDYESVGEWETLAGKLLTDPEYVTAVANNSATFIPGSIHDDIWRKI